jgi:hypothetical protein
VFQKVPKNKLWRKTCRMPQVSKETASQIAVEFLKKQKNTEKIDVAVIEENSEGWTVRGTCPIDLEGHPWAEKFAVVVDWKGKIKTTDYALL